MANDQGFTSKTKPLPKGVLGFPPTAGSKQNFSKDSGNTSKGGFTPAVGGSPFPMPQNLAQPQPQQRNRGKKYVIVLKALDADGDEIVREMPVVLPEDIQKLTDLRAWTVEEYEKEKEKESS